MDPPLHYYFLVVAESFKKWLQLMHKHAMAVERTRPMGGTLIFSYIRRLGPFFGVQNFEFQYFLGF